MRDLELFVSRRRMTLGILPSLSRGERQHAEAVSCPDAVQSRLGLAWNSIELEELNRVHHLARAVQNMEPLRLMFAKIGDDDPAHLFSRDF